MNYNAIDLLKKDLTYLDEIITIYKQDLTEANEIIKLSGKTIEIANAEHCGWINYFHEKQVEVKIIKEYIQSKLNEIHSQIWIRLTEKMNIILTQKDKETYIKSDQQYLEMNEKFLMIQELHDQFNRVVDSFEKRGYCLNNLTRLIIASANDWVIP
jgi:hypothetical protein